MKYRLLYLIIFVFLICTHSSSNAQINLVYNGNFEIYDTCPDSYSIPGNIQIEKCIGWTIANWGTSDYFNSCAPLSSFVNVPFSIWGYQEAYSGNAYTGIYSYTQLDTYREYIQSQLLEPLVSNTEYYVEFHVNLANRSTYGTNRIGALITSYRPYHDGWDYISAQPQVQNPLDRLISDTVEWVKVSGSFIAQGGESYITIGNFFDWTETDTTEPRPFPESTYYYIDSVVVCKKENLSHNVYVPNAFSPNNDGANDILFVRTSGFEAFKFCVYNRWGEQVFCTENIHQGWDGKTDGKLSDSGVFYYLVEIRWQDDSVTTKKGNITLFR